MFDVLIFSMLILCGAAIMSIRYASKRLRNKNMNPGNLEMSSFYGSFLQNGKGAQNGTGDGFQRIETDIPVKMDTAQGMINARVASISMGGAFVCCEKPLPLQEKFDIIFDLSDVKTEPIHAEVIWSNANVPAQEVTKRGMGVRFVDNTEETRVFLKDFISTHYEQVQV